MKNKTFYKPLVLTPTGELISIWAGTGKGVGQTSGTRLTYKEGEITYCPQGSMGIWVNKTLKGAIYQVTGGANAKWTKVETGGIAVIHTIIALGESMPLVGEDGFSHDLRYPAILLGKRVWEDEPPRPPAKFKIGDRVRGFRSYAEGVKGVVTKVFWAKDEGYNHATSAWLYNIDTALFEGGTPFNVGEDMLELVPEKPKVSY